MMTFEMTLAGDNMTFDLNLDQYIGGKADPATRETLGVIRVGDNLSITADGVLSVDTTNDAERDNTKPITSAGVYTQLGNIEVLLASL